jgi:glutaredoxin 3
MQLRVVDVERVLPYKIYSKAGCIFCDAAMELLEAKGIEYEEIKVPGNEEATKLFKMNKFKTVPQIFTDRDVWIGGFQDLKKKLN